MIMWYLRAAGLRYIPVYHLTAMAMHDEYLLEIGFEPLPYASQWQTTMYVHRHTARDGARLYLSVPRTASAAAGNLSDASEELQLAATVRAFFQKHGGRMAAPHPAALDLVAVA
ncbi:hypothetical protein GCM10023186_29040 [Hymenobacter koreensis]|uniref:Uncharacterized protein n=2 Tax=Hymenobacter koreensis TaxID=1084523 RepID=A0ABP8J5N3_9BACT